MNDPAPDHDELRTWAASYVLGVLDPAERSFFARHLQTCDDCRAEVAALAPVPGLLASLSTTPGVTAPTSTPTALDTAPRTVLDGAVRRARAARRREQRALRTWRGAAVAAALLAVAAVVSRPSDGDERAEPTADVATTTIRTATTAAPTQGTAPSLAPGTTPSATSPVGATTTTVSPDAVTLTLQPSLVGSTEGGTVRLESRRWGTALFLDASGLPERDVYTLWAVASDGRREPAASWGPTPSGRTTCAGATSISAEQLARLEIGDGAGVLATATNA